MSLYEIRGLREWIDDYGNFELYEELPLKSRMTFQLGQFYKAHVKYPLVAPPKVLELEKYDPLDESKTTYKIKKFDAESQSQSHFPIKSLNLRSNERLYILKGKPRTVITLGYIETEWHEQEKDKLVLCLPIASFKPRHTVEQIISIQLFEVSHLFYIKPSPKGANKEGAARFELIQPIQSGELQPVKNTHNSPFKLSSCALKLLFNHFAKFLFGKPLYEEIEGEIAAFRDLIREVLKNDMEK